MGLFERLPKTDRFCWCTRNLKFACFVIIILGMLTSIHTGGFLCKPVCDELYTVQTAVKLALNIFRWLLFVSEMALLCSAFAFLLGIFWSFPITAYIFTIVVMITCVFIIVYTVLMVIQEYYTQCRWYNSQIFHLILYLIMWGYFVIITNSYYEEQM